MNGYWVLACFFGWMAALSFIWWIAEVNAHEARKKIGRKK